MNSTIPEKALVAVPDFENLNKDSFDVFRIVPPEQAFVPAFDRSFHFGDSLYEVTRTYNGVLFSLEEHFRRLKKSAELGRYRSLPDLDLIQRMVKETCRAFFQKFGNTDVYVRITVSRGFGDLNIDPSYASSPYALVYVKKLEPFPDKLYSEGMHYAVVPTRRNHPDTMNPAMKSGNYLNNVLAIDEAKALGASDAVMLSVHGFVTEGTTNNVHCVRDGKVWTAPLSVGILAGITRDWLLDLAPKAGIEIQERLFTAQDLATADEMFLSSSTKEIMPITKLNNQAIGTGKPGPITKKLHQAMREFIADYCQQHRTESLYL